jgi:DNA-directed RNA polymerase subunit RPC12/RpoP
MTHAITKYVCDLCGREYANNSNALRHERKCYYAPANMACATCKHMMAIRQEVDEIRDFLLAECDIAYDLEDTGMCNGSVGHVFRSYCPGWENRTVKGTYKFGKTFIEVQS